MPLIIPIPMYGGRTSVRYMRNYTYYPHDVMLGNLPEDFLRIPYTGYGPLPSQENGFAPRREALVGKLEITFLSASLKKNYGISRMDPYIRMRYGNHVYETPTSINGAKAPYWNKTFYIYNPKRSLLNVEIYDERTLTEDELIAWTNIEMPEGIWNGDIVDQTFSLSGKLGSNQEGSLKVTISYSVGPPPAQPPIYVMPSYGSYLRGPPVYTLPPAYPVQAYAPAMASYPTGVVSPPGHHPVAIIKEEDVKQLIEMFPKMDRNVIVSILEASNGNKGTAINALLEM